VNKDDHQIPLRQREGVFYSFNYLPFQTVTPTTCPSRASLVQKNIKICETIKLHRSMLQSIQCTKAGYAISATG